ncbi:MAG: DNA repair protein RadC [Candidatus Dojkabacteria bacterium]|nr:DNA repair protein RadC [Candidatus Dojkabacteria bacterium]MDQ7021808.1 DNA repair protein RadC [Candidatus Dojkabacteria bacterium]
MVLKKKNVLQLAKEVESKTTRLTDIKVEELNKIKGLGETKIAQLIAITEIADRINNSTSKICITESKQIWEKCFDIYNKHKEHLLAFYLDVGNNLIKRELISIGNLTESLVHPREVYEPAIRHSAFSLLIVHNHPSGNIEPSNEDVRVTKALIEAGNILGIPLLDHVIVGQNGWYSIKENYSEIFS